MKILVHDYSGHPFQVQLSRSLAKRGYNILHVYSGSFQTPHGKLIKRDCDPDNFEIFGIQLSKPFNKYSFIKRRNQEVEYGNLLIEKVLHFNPDIVISANTPLDAQNILLKKCVKEKIKFIFWLQDLYEIAIQKILSKKIPVLGKLIGHYYVNLERTLLRKSDSIVLITEDFVPLMNSYSVQQEKVHVIHNWAPIGEIPALPRINQWSKEHGLNDKFCFLYAGTLGLKHNPELILKLALHFKKNDKIRVIVMSEGMGMNWLREKKAHMRIDNLILKDFQPYELLPSVLASADVLLAVLEPDAGIFSVPSKVLTYLCVGRPLLLAMPSENLAAKIVKNNDAGIIVNPNDYIALIQAAESLMSDKNLCEKLGQNAIVYAKESFDIETITNKFVGIISSL